MNVLITGGAGYIGNELTYHLLQNPAVDKIFIYDNLSRKNYNLFLDSQYPKGKVNNETKINCNKEIIENSNGWCLYNKKWES